MKKHKVGLKFTLRMAGALLVGVVLGICAVLGGEVLQPALVAVQRFLQRQAALLMLAALLALLGPAAALYCSGCRWRNRVLADAGGEDEEAFEKADRRYSYSMLLTGAAMVVVMVLFAVGCSDFSAAGGRGALLLVLGLMVGCVLTTVLQARLVAGTKQLYPEKRGSVLDNRFQQDWYASCDEAEQQQIGRAAYASMQATGKAAMALWLLLVLLSILVPIGVLPALMVGALWLVQMLSYQWAGMKLEKGWKKRPDGMGEAGVEEGGAAG